MTDLTLALSSLLCCDLTSERVGDLQPLDRDLEATTENESLSDVSAFLMLLSQIQCPPIDEQKQYASDIIETKSEVSEDVTLKLETATSWEDNVAVTWINSEYYEKGDSDLNLSKAETQVEFVQPLTDYSNTTELAPEQRARENPVFSEMESKISLPQSIDASVSNHQDEINSIISKELVLQAAQEMTLKPEGDDLKPLNQDISGFSVPKQFIVNQTSEQDQTSLTKQHDHPDSLFMTRNITERFLSDKEPLQAQADFSSGTLNPVLSSEDLMITTPTSMTTSAFVGNQPISDKITMATPTFTLPVPAEHPQWSEYLAEHTLWVGQSGQQSALLKIHPEELGPLQIQVQVTGDQAAVHIVSPTSELRELIDQSVSRLQELMAEQGLKLLEVNVQAGDARSQQRFDESAAIELHEQEVMEHNTSVVPRGVASQNLIDYFA